LAIKVPLESWRIGRDRTTEAYVLAAAAPGHVELVRRLFFGGVPREHLDGLAEALERVYANIVDQGSLPPPE
jgi:hypothetical protein